MATKAADWPRVRKRVRTIGVTGDGKQITDYCIDLGIVTGGKRVQYFKATKHEAKQFAKFIREARKKHGLAFLQFTQSQMIDASVAIEMIGGRVSLREVAEYYITHHPAKSTGKVSELISERIKAMEMRGKREVSINSTKKRLEIFKKQFATREIMSVTTKDLENWLIYERRLRGWSASTINGYITELKALFSFAKRCECINDNPAENLQKHTTDEKMPAIMAPSDVARLFSHVEKIEPSYACQFAISFFAGVRPGELEKLNWGDVNTGEKIITVSPSASKVRRARHIYIEKNLLLWLSSGTSGPLVQSDFARKRRDICKLLGIKWTPDVARHTFATLHLAKYKDAAHTAHELGHVGGVDTLYRHYRGLATVDEAEQFWAIEPKEGEVHE